MAAPLPARNQQREKYIANSRWSSWTCDALTSDASFRRYFRLSKASESVLLMDAPPSSENLAAYIKIAEYLCSIGLSAPQVFDADLSTGFAVIEDFGEDTYTQLLNSGSDTHKLYELAVDALKLLHQHQPPAEFKYRLLSRRLLPKRN